jgi:glutamate-1-semialdehyde 2,1-aminomutase
MDHCPVDWHDLATYHDFDLDLAFRKALIDRGVYVFPQAAKQCSLSAAHDVQDVEVSLREIEAALACAASRQVAASS